LLGSLKSLENRFRDSYSTLELLPGRVVRQAQAIGFREETA